MPSSHTLPALPPQDAPEDATSDHNSLIPTPTAQPPKEWQDAAEAICQLYTAQRPPFPACGRGSALTDTALIAHLLTMVSNGLSPAQAATACGIWSTTVSRWMQRADAEPQSAFNMLRSALESAKERRRNRLLASIESAGHRGPQYWTAHAWLLERGYGNDYKLAQDKTGGGVVIQIGIKDSEVTANVGVTDADITLPPTTP